jgi:hypothetical protein
MLVVAVQLPLELEPEANAGVARATTAQIRDVRDLVLTTKPPSPRWMSEKRRRLIAAPVLQDP